MDDYYQSLLASHRSEEWRHTWRHPESSFSYKIAHEHLLTAEMSIKDPDLLTHLKTSTIMIKSVHSDQVETPNAIDKVRTAFDDVKSKQEFKLKRALRSINERQATIKKKQEDIYAQLSQIQTSMELLVSVLLGDDAKRGEIIQKSKCSPGSQPQNDAEARGDKGGNGKFLRSNKDGSSASGSKTVDTSINTRGGGRGGRSSSEEEGHW